MADLAVQPDVNAQSAQIEWICRKCGESKPLDQFRTQILRNGKLFRHHSCKVCLGKAQQSRRQFDEEYKLKQRKWHRQWYRALSPEQRAEFSRKCTDALAQRMADPEYAARMRRIAMLKKREKSTPEQRALWAAASRKHRDLHP